MARPPPLALRIVLFILLPLALAVQQPVNGAQYSTDALRELVRAAAETNVRVPPGLAAYRATVETEVALVTVDPRAREQSVQVEQVAQTIDWDRTGRVDQHVIGYRSQASVFSGFSVLRMPTWVVPVLYGNRFSLFFGPRSDGASRGDSAAGSGGSTRPGDGAARERGGASRGDGTLPADSATARRVMAIHPLARDRDTVYRYSGGDTVAVVEPQGRSIPVVRVRVDPIGVPDINTTVMRGEILIESATHQLIAMRGEILQVGGQRSVLGRIGAGMLQAVAYIDFQSREVEGRYWLPSTQRLEFQMGSPLAGDARAVMRFQSRFDDVAIVQADTTVPPGQTDTLAARPRRRTLASGEELNAFDRWRWTIGEGTADLRADDFVDVAVAVRDGESSAVRVTRGVYARSFDEVIRFNRVEGIFTGLGVRARVHDARRSLSLGGSIGRAWHEGAVRGSVFAELDARDWTLTAAGERRLDIANPFGNVRQSGSAGTIAALLGSDDFDYLDRRRLAATLERDLASRDARVAVDASIASDRGVDASVSRGLFRVDSAFRPNRAADAGSYAHAGLSLVMHPDVYAEWARPGWTASMRIEQAAGALAWTRVEVSAASRANVGRFTVTAHVDAGLVESGRIPLQQLIAVGGLSDVPGFEYREFGGDRAIVGRGSVRYALPILQAPLRLPLGRRAPVNMPPIAPMLAVALRGVWTDASSRATLEALDRLGSRPGGVLLTRPTDGMPAAASAGVLLFGGSLFVGVSRRLDTHARWSFTFAPSIAL